LPFKQRELKQNGWAIECRIYAEDCDNGFVPAPGRIERMRLPEGPGVRNDAGVYEGSEVSVYYDPMISKLVTWGRDRTEAIGRMRRALTEYAIGGTLITNLDFHRWLMRHPRFVAGDFDTHFIEHEFRAAKASGEDPLRLAAMLAAAVAAQHDANHAQPAVAAAGPRQTPWKTFGRLDAMRR
jgi:acetyl-CoA carboxylase biotin carboxylase subunit